jgi:hypothetical protein
MPPVGRENPIPVDIIDVFALCQLRRMSLLLTVIRAAIRTLFMRKQALLLENLIRSFKSLRQGRGSWSRYRRSGNSSTTIDWWRRQVRERGPVRGSDKDGALRSESREARRVCRGWNFRGVRVETTDVGLGDDSPLARWLNLARPGVLPSRAWCAAPDSTGVHRAHRRPPPLLHRCCQGAGSFREAGLGGLESLPAAERLYRLALASRSGAGPG